MTLPDIIPIWWKVGAALAIAGAALAVDAYRVHSADAAGFERATTERAARDASAVFQRVQDNSTVAAKQDALNKFLTKDKDEKLAPVIARITTERVRVGPALCGGPSAAAQTKDAPGSDGANPPARLVRADIERDLIALKIAVENDLATGRTCQAWGVENGFTP